MKTTILKLLFFLFSSFVYSTEIVLTGGNQNDVLAAITTLNLEGGGVIIINGDINIDSDITIPEIITIRIVNSHKLIIKGNITLTINGFIDAGSYQIFEQDDNGTVEDCFWDRWDFSLDDGKVRGNLKNAHVIPQWWGVDDTGTIPCGQSFQNAIESFPNVQKFVANGKFLLEKTLHLNQDNRYYDFSGATFVGVNVDRDVCQAFKESYPLWYTTPSQLEELARLPETWPATDSGGLINIGKRRDLTETSPYSVQNVTLYGGIYIPMSKYDNALGILNAKNIKILSVTINCYNGLRGIAIQHPTYWNVPTRTDHVIIRDVTQQGGANVFNIDMLQDRPHTTSNVIVSNIVGHDIDGTGIPGSTDKEAAFRISSQGPVQKIHNISISEVILSTVYKGFNINGANGIISNIQVINSETDWLNSTNNPDLKIETIRIL